MDGIERTLDVLLQSTDSRAIALLIDGLESAPAWIREVIALRLLRSPQDYARLAALRRLSRLSRPVEEWAAAHVADYRRVFVEGFRTGSDELRQELLDALRRLDAWRLTSLVVDHLIEMKSRESPAAWDLYRRLVWRLWDLRAAREVDSRAIESTVQSSLKLLEHLDTLEQPDAVVEALLILGPSEELVHRKLWHSVPRARELAEDLLRESTHPGVMQVICDALRNPYPSPRCLEMLQTRCDLDFVCHLLRAWPSQPTPQQIVNARQLSQLNWLDESSVLELIPDSLQPALVRFIDATGLTANERRSRVECVLRHGGPLGRQAAAVRLQAVGPQLAHELAIDGLSSDDVGMQTWTTSHLRELIGVEAMPLLIAQLDHPHAAVREAARQQLSELTPERAIAALSTMSDAEAQRLGQLLKKLDVQAPKELAALWRQSNLHRRIDALVATVRLGWQHELLSGLVKELDDPEPLIRRALVDVLQSISDPMSQAALIRLQDDLNPRVADAARLALRRLQERHLTRV